MNQGCSEIFSGSENGYVYSWNVVSSKVEFMLKHGTEKAVHSLNYHPDENKLLTAQEQFIYLWNASKDVKELMDV